MNHRLAIVTAAACANLFYSTPIAAQPPGVASLRATYVAQKNCPLWIVGRRMTPSDLYSEVYVANNSSSEILRAQLGWIIADSESPSHRTITRGTQFDLKLAPGMIGTVGRQGAAFSLVEETLKGLGARFGKLTLGVVYVRFVNGNEWSLDLPAKGDFEKVDDSEVTLRFGPQIGAFIEAQKAREQQQTGCLTPAELRKGLLKLAQSGGCGSGGAIPGVE